ncbi:MAG TPA: hypothetical protein PKM97_00410 [Bacteroidia bacterium]|nr:hypothetical protein [Bacteroidia bacterium]
MKKSIILFLLIAGSVCFTGDVFGASFEKVFYKEVVLEKGPVTVTITDGVSTKAYIKFKLRVKNNTSDYILVSTDQIILKADGKDYKNLEKDLLIGPNDEESRVIDIKGEGLQFEKFSLELKGFATVKAEEGAIKAENFKLPIVKNDFTAGPFKIVQLKSTKKTDDVVVKFSVDYTGDKIGIVHPGKASLLTPKGTEFANMASRGQRRANVLKKGQSDTFVVLWKDIPVSNGDMQKVDIEILWHDTFRDTVAEAFPLPDVEVEIDTVLSNSKNK